VIIGIGMLWKINSHGFGLQLIADAYGLFASATLLLAILVRYTDDRSQTRLAQYQSQLRVCPLKVIRAAAE
jgi:hypothetical protein